MKNIIKLLSICLVYGVCSCSDLTFGDKFMDCRMQKDRRL